MVSNLVFRKIGQQLYVSPIWPFKPYVKVGDLVVGATYLIIFFFLIKHP